MAISRRLRYEILRRDNHTCRYCGGAAPDVKLTVDHVVPVALGGGDDPTNLVAACQDCNAGKTSTSPDAPLVDEVSAAALRWAHAMQASADARLDNLRVVLGARSEFNEAWDAWRRRDEPAPRPDTWERSVDTFHAAGLPFLVLKECIRKAMTNEKISSDDKFRYMCGIAWREITAMQEVALEIADIPDAAGSGAS